jgi:hypothetical protein
MVRMSEEEKEYWREKEWREAVGWRHGGLGRERRWKSIKKEI